MGFDTECDLVLEASGQAEQAARSRITALRTELLAHWLGCSSNVVADALGENDGHVTKTLEALRNAGYTRLRPDHARRDERGVRSSSPNTTSATPSRLQMHGGRGAAAEPCAIISPGSGLIQTSRNWSHSR